MPGVRGRRLIDIAFLLYRRDRAQRVLLGATLVQAFGTGLFLTGGALYFTQVVGLSATQVGAGFGVSAVVSLVISLPAGRMIDRLDARWMYPAQLVLGALASAAMLVVHSFLAYLAVSTVTGVVAGVGKAIRPVMIRSLSGDELVEMRSAMAACTNLGISLGSLAGAVALQFSGSLPFHLLIVGNATGYGIAALSCTRLPHVAFAPGTGARLRQRLALADSSFTAVTVVNAIYSLHFSVFTFALPLWIVEHTDAPHWMTGAGLIVNSVLMVILQAPVGRRVRTLADARTALALVAVATFAGLAVFGLSSGAGTLAAAVLIMTSVLLLTAAEVLQTSAGLEFSFGMAPEGRQGEYSALFFLGQSAMQAVAPTVIGAVAFTYGSAGWLALGACYLVLAPGVHVLLRRIEKRKGQDPAACVAPQAVTAGR